MLRLQAPASLPLLLRHCRHTRLLSRCTARSLQGACIVWCVSLAQPKLLAGSLGFAAGVML